MAILFRADKDFQTSLYKGITIVDTDNATYGVADLNGDPVLYIELDYIKGDEDGIVLTFDLGTYNSSDDNLMREIRLVKRDYDDANEVYVDSLKKLELKITESISTFYFIPIPISNDQFRINVETLNGDEPNDLKINIKSQTFRS